MANSFYNQSGYPGYAANGDSASARSEFLSIQQGFDKLPSLSGTASRVIRVNAGSTALEAVPTASLNIPASEIVNTPAGSITTANVQLALNELDTKKAPNILTGFVSAAGTVAATDSVLQAIQKLDGNNRWAAAEIPAGAINGTNVIFTLAHAPLGGASFLPLYKNGMYLRPGTDFTLTGATITLAVAPLGGATPDTLDAAPYRY